MIYDPSFSACFTGHRNLEGAPLDLLVSALERRIRNLYERGITHFYAGGALGFDMLASVTLLNLKNELPGLTLSIVLPCRGHTKGWSPADVALFERISARADETLCLADTYRPGCMSARNRYMVERSSVCLCYLIYATGGTAYTVGYARRRGLLIVNLAKELYMP
ncbi:MAG TPA: SLOG family protein [Bacillota bacterium]|nr:DUF1273 domain-containing protein [Clostridiales bacterium]HPT86003.1 SLOG family protein [Bacillota bacterium]